MTIELTMKSKIISFLVLSLLHFSVCILSGALGWQWQSVIVPATCTLVMVIAVKKYGFTPLTGLAITAPFFLVYVTAVFVVKASYVTYPIWIAGLILAVLTYLYLAYQVNPLISISLLALLIAVNGLLVWPNLFAWVSRKDNPGIYRLANVSLMDNDDNIIPSGSLKGKVVLTDIWHSSCYNCIKGFPELQQLYNEFRNDTSVRIISLNMPLAKDNGIKPAKYTDRYGFEKLYFASAQEADKLFIEAVPLVLIFGKDGRCRYAGDLNTGWNIFTGNARQIINQLRNE